MKIKDWCYKRIAYLLPKGILYYCIIRIWADLTVNVYPKKTPYEVNWEMACGHLSGRSKNE